MTEAELREKVVHWIQDAYQPSPYQDFAEQADELIAMVREAGRAERGAGMTDEQLQAAYDAGYASADPEDFAQEAHLSGLRAVADAARAELTGGPPYCGSRQPDGKQLLCTLRQGHRGRHVAQLAEDGPAVAEWSPEENA